MSIEIEMTKIKKDIEYTRTNVNDIKDNIKSLHKKFDSFILSIPKNYTAKDEFILWRNLLIVGILGTIFMSIITNLFK